MTMRHFEETLQHLKRKKAETVELWVASWSECECLWGCWSAQRAGWKVNSIQEFPGQVTLQKLTFWHSRPHPFLCELEFWIVGLNPGPVRGSRFVAKLPNPEVSREKHAPYVVFAGGRLAFLKLGSASVGFGGGVWIYFEIHGEPNLCFSVWEFSPVESSMHTMINPYVFFFYLFCVFIVNGVRACVDPGKKFKFSAS